jgi:hypothetical protein
VAIEVLDPEGVLGAVPASIDVGAGNAEARVPLFLNDVAGVATIRLRAGEESLEVRVLSRTQGWSSLPVVRVPLGARAAVPFWLTHREPEARGVEARVEEGASARLEPGAETTSLAPGVTLWAVNVEGAQMGRSTVRLECEGLPALRVPIEVTAPRVQLGDGSIRLMNLPLGTTGSIRIDAPLGVTFRSVSVPAQLADAVAIEGVGSDRIRITILADPDMPATLVLPTELDGVADGALVFDVLEELEEDEPRPWRNDYQLSGK